MNGKGAGDRNDITQSSQVHPIAAGTSESIEKNVMLPNCATNFPRILEDFCKNMVTNISQNQMKTSSSSTTKQDQMRLRSQR